jgi:hypothetical protein
MGDLHNNLQARAEAFAADLMMLVRRAAIDAVREALGEPAPGLAKTPPASRAQRPPKGAAPRKASKPRVVRDREALAKLVERLAGHIKANPGQRMDHIRVALGLTTRELALPIKKLLAEKRITSKGQRRGMTYSPR